MSDLVFVGLSTFGQYDEAPVQALERSGIPFRIHRSGKRITGEELHAHAADASVIIAGVEVYDSATLAGLPALRCIARCGAGTDNIDLEAAAARGVTVVNTPTIPTAAVAELAVTMMLALARNLVIQANHMQRHEWRRVEAHLIGGLVIGLIGFGRIGRRVAELLRPFGARLLASDPHVSTGDASVQGVCLVPLQELLRTSDIVSIHAARVTHTPCTLAERELASMKPGALIVNVARGGMIDEKALHDAIVSGRLGGAALDVYADEPYSGPLCDLGNVILTPHAATLTVETRVAMEVECVEKAIRFLRRELKPEERVA